jgi:glycosyltransferase involved in cell wall biosynthesis
MKYPNIIFLRDEVYNYIDSYLNDNKDNIIATLNITSDVSELNKLYDPNYQLLITFGDVNNYIGKVEYIMCDRLRKRWLHFNELKDIPAFNRGVNYCFINNVLLQNRVTFSLFTTCYNSYEKIIRAYNSIKTQRYNDWEWVILDDSPDDNHFNFLRNIFKHEKKVRLYKRSENSGNIGNVKNEAVLLCRGKYVLEMDHDDEILPDVLYDAVNVFENDPDIGFVYMDFANVAENGDFRKYCDFFGNGYCGYYCQKYNNKWYFVASTANINNVTLTHIVSVPNHPRIWRKDVLIKIGNYSEFLPCCDDYELLIRTALYTKMAKIHKFGYIQYMNDNNNNFSLIRNSEINRLCTDEIRPQYFDLLKIHDKMEEIGACEDYNVVWKQMWKRENYQHKFCNKIINVNHKTQYCILGLDTFFLNEKYIVELYQNRENDFILLDNQKSYFDLMNVLDEKKLENIKCYALENTSIHELINYFKLIYKSCDDYVILFQEDIIKE